METMDQDGRNQTIPKTLKRSNAAESESEDFSLSEFQTDVTWKEKKTDRHLNGSSNVVNMFSS